MLKSYLPQLFDRHSNRWKIATDFCPAWLGTIRRFRTRLSYPKKEVMSDCSRLPWGPHFSETEITVAVDRQLVINIAQWSVDLVNEKTESFVALVFKLGNFNLQLAYESFPY
jgi:hypothetical protein